MDRAADARLTAALDDWLRDARFPDDPAEEAIALRRFLDSGERRTAPVRLRLWREAYALRAPWRAAVWGGKDPAGSVDLARRRFGEAAAIRVLDKPEAALALASDPRTAAVLPLQGPWWGRLLARPDLQVFAALPDYPPHAPVAALAVARLSTEPSGHDETWWVSDAPGPGIGIEDALSRDGVAGRLVAESGGLKLFALAGYFQRHDERLARAPGRLSGVIGTVPLPYS